jgi:hypothetical protein
LLHLPLAGSDLFFFLMKLKNQKISKKCLENTIFIFLSRVFSGKPQKGETKRNGAAEVPDDESPPTATAITAFVTVTATEDHHLEWLSASICLSEIRIDVEL